ncbi:ribosome-associated translation inhibitor RaiA [Spongiivirga sp. MCCC 1A20706]|uniref:ribosome hibernation-promoting factor, HPF/YfiA family n=1 Tax=Spongiivirga sp. MCCC 1A20706 TaxID=3160963 RepID=UPI00397783DA
MQIVYEYVNIAASARLQELLEKKLNRLEEKYSDVIRADVFFKKENTKDDFGHICTIRLSLKGPQIVASSDEIDFEKSVLATIDDLKDQLERRKTKLKRKAI